MKLRIGDYHAGLYCGEKLWRVCHWYRYYGLFKKTNSGFSFGPILFWKAEHLTTDVTSLLGFPMRITKRKGRIIGIEGWVKMEQEGNDCSRPQSYSHWAVVDKDRKKT